MPLLRQAGHREVARRSGRIARSLLALGLATASLAACSGTNPPSSQAAGPRFVVTTPILGSIASMIVACTEQGTVEVLMPNGADPHDFAPSSAQVADLVTADLVIANGLGLEAGMQAALESASTDGGKVWEVGPEVDPIPFDKPQTSEAHSDNEASPDGQVDGDGEVHGNEHGHSNDTLDPHFWFDMSRMSRAAELMGEQMQASSTSGSDTDFAECGRRAAAQITSAEAEVRKILESIPMQRRILVTDHEALGYLAHAYGFEIVGAVVPSASTLAEPTSADLAELASLIRDRGVRAIFSNVSQPSQLANAVAEESGTEVVVVPLFIESLGEPGSPASDYIGMMRANAGLIASGLAG